jgi:hypothetical protein
MILDLFVVFKDRLPFLLSYSQNCTLTVNWNKSGEVNCKSYISVLFEEISVGRSFVNVNPMIQHVKQCMEDTINHNTANCTMAVREVYKGCTSIIKPLMSEVINTKAYIEAKYISKK